MSTVVPSKVIPKVKKVKKIKKVAEPEAAPKVVEPETPSVPEIVETVAEPQPEVVETSAPTESDIPTSENIQEESGKVVKKRKVLSEEEKKERQVKRKADKALEKQKLLEENELKLQDLKEQQKALKQASRKLKPKKTSSGGLSKTKVLSKAAVAYFEKHLDEELLDTYYDNGSFKVTRPQLTSLFSKVFKKKNLCNGMAITVDDELKVLLNVDELNYFHIQKHYGPLLSDLA